MSKELNTEIIAVGTELLLGQISNTNAKWISEQLANNGINTFYHTVVGDNLDRLKNIFEQAQERSDTIIITGGLGPTEDDLSREAFEKISGIPIETHEQSLQRIKEFFEQRQIKMTMNNKRQARVFKDSTVFLNKTGMAPGNLVNHKGVRWIFLPGVPREMKQMFSDNVLPYLSSLNGHKLIYSKVLKFIDIGESTLEDKLYHLIQGQQNPTIAPLATRDGITVRITAKAKDEKEAMELINKTKHDILHLVGDYFYGEDEESIAQIAADLLKQHHKTISAAESLTGGWFADKMVASPGISTVFKGSVVCYAPEVKEKLLDIPSSVINHEGTVSATCARLLAVNVSEVMNTDIGISFTGVAGPDAIEGQQSGTVFISLYDQDGFQQIEECHFHGDRKQVRYRSVIKGYSMLIKYLKNL